jgi:exopolyphosphatase/guanosine-5'-triphosphate,3'-diphosphate pyrophosphatase
LICACIDIGSNTTRLLVADASDGQLREVVTQRAFTRLGKSLNAGGAIPPAKIAETADVVRTQATVARQVGAERVVAVATAAIRNAPNRDELLSAVEEAG